MNFFDNKNLITNDPWLRPRNLQVIESRFEEVISCSFVGHSRGQRIIGPNSTVSFQAKVDGFIVKVDSLRIEFAGTNLKVDGPNV